MKLVKVLLLSLTFCAFTFTSFAAEPPCDVASRQDTLNLSGGNAVLCVPEVEVDGDAIPVVKTLDCTVTFFDEDGSEIGVQNVVAAAPGTAHNISVPRDGVGNAVSVCTVDGLSSDIAEGTVDEVVFPTDAAPLAPILLEQ